MRTAAHLTWGEGGDRFAAQLRGHRGGRGIGDFYCEYTSSGVVIHLSGYGKDPRDGMSGGFVYRYDPTPDGSTTT